MSAVQRERASGVLLHLSSLPGPHGCGDLGRPARDFVDFLAGARQRYWQLLPIHPLGVGNSPYSALSAFAGNPLFVDLNALVQAKLLQAEEIGRALPQGPVDYARTERHRVPLLRLAFTRFQRRPQRYAAELRAFRARARYWLNDYCLFMALRAQHGEAWWERWPKPLARREGAALAHARRELRSEVAYYEFEQWLFARQWQALRQYAAQRSVRLIGDIPIFVAHDSADVWAQQPSFLLDRAGRPRVVSGVPPDYFSSDGQRWGTPLYDWRGLARQDYAFWVERLRSLCAAFDLVRLDHFIGFVRAWHIPVSSPTAKSGRFRPGPGRALFERVERALGGLPFIAEDLGTVTPAVEALRDGLALPGMRVLQFAFNGDPANPFLPHNYVRNSVAYTGTHDNDTLLGFVRHAATPSERRALHAYLGHAQPTSDEQAVSALLNLLFTSVADLCIVPVQDLLALDNDARMNVPGLAQGNWTFRIRPRALNKQVQSTLRALTLRTGRASPAPAPSARRTRSVRQG
jgi:4-alpha-glucanotransferase